MLAMDYAEFRELVWDYYAKHQRELPWRQPPYDAYRILVSEMMLQQTQVKRVIPKYQAFLAQFPDAKSLAQASLADVIRAWSGLGYNRRAKYLREAAIALSAKSRPWSLADLTACKGVGVNTAAAVLTYAYNEPHVFIETNIRTVYIHHFFPDRDDVTDKELLPHVATTLDHEHPREFMWALMDYGSFLKSSIGNVSRASKHHTVQSRFEGSRRQVRGQILRALHEKPSALRSLQRAVPDSRLASVLEELEQDGLIKKQQQYYRLAD